MKTNRRGFIGTIASLFAAKVADKPLAVDPISTKIEKSIEPVVTHIPCAFYSSAVYYDKKYFNAMNKAFPPNKFLAENIDAR